MMGALLRGVSTHQYEEVLPQMADTVGVSLNSISRQAIERSAEQLQQLQERRRNQADLLAIYIDSQRFCAHHVLSALGVDRGGSKQILGIELGATENAAAVKALLTRLREQGLPTDRNICSSLIAPTPYGPGSKKCSASITQCSVAEITRCVLYR